MSNAVIEQAAKNPSKAALLRAAAVIREKAETDTTTWAAYKEWLRVAELVEKLEQS